MRRSLAAGALAVGVLLIGTVAAPAPARASTVYTPTGAVTPVLECVSRGTDGTWTAVLGYTNRAATKTIPHGSWNAISPTKYDGTQPTLFTAGTVHGAWTLKLAAYDYTYQGTTWMLDGNMVFVGATFDQGIPTCTALQLPAEGNDTGAGIALLVAGVLGALVVVRLRRRALAAAGAVPPASADVADGLAEATRA